MKKTKKKHPKTHGKAKQRARAAARSQRSERPAPLESVRESLTKFMIERSPGDRAEIIEMISAMSDDEIVKRIATAANKKGGRLDDDFDEDEPDEDETDFERFVELCRTWDIDDEAEIKRRGENSATLLKTLKVHSELSGTEPPQAMAEINELLASTIEDENFSTAGLIQIAKVLANATWNIPEALKQAIVRSLEKKHGLERGSDELKRGLVAVMDDLTEKAADEFTLYESVTSLLAVFPTDLAAPLVEELARTANGAMERALVGFALHRQMEVAEAALNALARSLRSVDSLVVDRLARVRAWTPPERHALIDAALEALRPYVRPSAKPPWSKVEKLYATTCDVMGGYSLLGQIRESGSFKALSALIGPKGVYDAMTMASRKRAESLANLNIMRNETEVGGADARVIEGLLSLGLADNLAKGEPPPFRLVQFVEQLGIGPVTPRAATAAEIADELLADLPAEATDASALARAYRDIAEAGFPSKWLVLSPKLNELLEDVDVERDGAEIVLKNEMTEERKAFWAWVCARSALALRGPSGRALSRDSLALALIVRDLVSDKPAENSPLLRRIAETTVKAYQIITGEWMRRPLTSPAAAPPDAR
jgi:hypothetical protein